ncbi:MAG: GAF domain-containing protein [Zoogloeaceae bacterium]|nr:GAF domain-containing protein [Zoogloeaceae bacterium]
MNDQPSLIDRLIELGRQVGELRQLEAELPRLAKDATRFFAADTCSIMLFKDDDEGQLRLRLSARSHPLPAGVDPEDPNLGGGLARQVAAGGQPVLIEDMAQLSLPARDRPPQGSCICAPIMVAGRVLGVFNLSRESAPFTGEDLALACHITLLLGPGLELERLHSLLRSRFAHRAMVTELANHPDLDPPALAQDTRRMARILGRSFFRELRAAGYGADHILTAATEVIGQLGQNIGPRDNPAAAKPR